MSHLESLIVEYLDWQGYLVRRNTKVGRLKHGGWEMELDVIGFNPHTGGVCQGSCRVSHFLSGLFILSLRVQIYRPDGCPIACAA